MDAIVIDDGLDFVEDISQRLVVQVEKDSPSRGELRLRWNGDGARGSASCATVRPGLNLMVTDVQTDMPWSFDVVHQPVGLELGFSRLKAVQVVDAAGMDLGGTAGQFALTHLREPMWLRCTSTPAREQSARLLVDLEALTTLFELDAVPVRIATLLAEDSAISCHSQAMTTAMFNAVDELTRCQMSGPMRQLYLESKSLELLTLSLEALDVVAPATSGPTLDAFTVEQLEHARSILLGSMSEPPSLRALARACGLNERKLKEGFKLRYGTTVFGFVREQRMLRAHDMLHGSGRSVTEVAQIVGYANPSKFAAAFRRQFGVAPSTVAWS